MKSTALSSYLAFGAYSGKTLVVHDGECPSVHGLWLVGCDLKRGMVLIWKDQITQYCSADVIDIACEKQCIV